MTDQPMTEAMVRRIIEEAVNRAIQEKVPPLARIEADNSGNSRWSQLGFEFMEPGVKARLKKMFDLLDELLTKREDLEKDLEFARSLRVRDEKKRERSERQTPWSDTILKGTVMLAIGSAIGALFSFLTNGRIGH